MQLDYEITWEEHADLARREMVARVTLSEKTTRINHK